MYAKNKRSGELFEVIGSYQEICGMSGQRINVLVLKNNDCKIGIAEGLFLKNYDRITD